MKNKNQIKREALKKLDKLVKMELKCLNDANSSITTFSLNIPKNYFTEEEKDEISNSIKQVQTNILNYCLNRGIDIPKSIKDIETPNQK